MCRYACAIYKMPFACFDCRKSFKQPNVHDLPDHIRKEITGPRICKCPQCGKPMASMGHDFKPPKQNDIKQWQKVEILYQHGFAFHSCGCCGPGFRPAELRDVEEFLQGQKSPSEGEQLLAKIQARSPLV